MPKWLFPTNTNNDGRTTFNNETKATMALNVNDGGRSAQVEYDILTCFMFGGCNPMFNPPRDMLNIEEAHLLPTFLVHS